MPLFAIFCLNTNQYTAMTVESIAKGQSLLNNVALHGRVTPIGVYDSDRICLTWHPQKRLELDQQDSEQEEAVRQQILSLFKNLTT